MVIFDINLPFTVATKSSFLEQKFFLNSFMLVVKLMSVVKGSKLNPCVVIIPDFWQYTININKNYYLQSLMSTPGSAPGAINLKKSL